MACSVQQKGFRAQLLCKATHLAAGLLQCCSLNKFSGEVQLLLQGGHLWDWSLNLPVANGVFTTCPSGWATQVWPLQRAGDRLSKVANPEFIWKLHELYKWYTIWYWHIWNNCLFGVNRLIQQLILLIVSLFLWETECFMTSFRQCTGAWKLSGRSNSEFGPLGHDVFDGRLRFVALRLNLTKNEKMPKRRGELSEPHKAPRPPQTDPIEIPHLSQFCCFLRTPQILPGPYCHQFIGARRQGSDRTEAERSIFWYKKCSVVCALLLWPWHDDMTIYNCKVYTCEIDSGWLWWQSKLGNKSKVPTGLKSLKSDMDLQSQPLRKFTMFWDRNQRDQYFE